jgi:4-hydroxyphenylpyruvate dioxygenase
MAMPTIDNPLGLNGFGFVEFSSTDPEPMMAYFAQMGFVEVARHKTKNTRLWRQGFADIIINLEPRSHAVQFAADHGPCASGMAFRVHDPKSAFALAIERGAKPMDASLSALGEDVPVIEGIGGALLYLVRDEEDLFTQWQWHDGWQEAMTAQSTGLLVLDHLTHNVRRGQMRVWSDYYSRLFGFEEQKYFNIKGQATGLFSQAMMAPDKAIRIPLNESQDDKSQIEEYLKEYKGEGIQHLAFTTEDIYDTVERLRARGVRLQDTILTYYDLVDKRVPGHGEDLERMKQNRILIDGDVESEGILLQIFTENLFGPIFLEIIQRKGNQGFGNGNFQALFESIELDQIRRGVITVA